MVYADSHNVLSFTIDTDAESYSTGDTILISGLIRDYDPTKGDVAILITDPQGTIVAIKQMPASNTDGHFAFTIRAGLTADGVGTMKLTGEYTIQAKWNAQPAFAKFEFVGGVAPVSYTHLTLPTKA